MVIIDTDEVLSAFLESDLAHWVKEPAIPPIERDAIYKCKLNIKDVEVTYEILVYRRSLKQDDMERNIVLSYALLERPWFGNRLLERNIVLSGTATDIASLTWPETDDAVVRKVAEIAKVAPLVTPSSQSLN